MDEERIGPLGGSAIDDDVAALLAVQPSPEFVARVRMQVASESFGHASFFATWGRAVALSALVAAVLVAAYVASDFSRTVPGDVEEHAWADVSVPMPAGEEHVGATSSPPASPPRRAAPMARVAMGDRPTAPSGPEIIVSPREAEGLRFVFNALRAGAPGILASSENPDPLAEIELEPVTIDAPLIAAVATQETLSD